MSRNPDETAPPEAREPFLSRWSRKKDEARHAPPAAQKPPEDQSPAPELPPLEQLTIDSDYRAFFHPKVGEDVRRAALKKLFSDPRFNVMDGLDVYIDDYSRTEPIPPEMLAGLRQAQNILAWAKEDADERRRKEETGSGTAPRETNPEQAALEAPEARTDPDPGGGLEVKVTEPAQARSSTDAGVTTRS